ncbi:MAG: hypothetical protein JWP36_1086 [Paucimonas sp.]|nr:hypothetical protein [Paucimonas sp.]
MTSPASSELPRPTAPLAINDPDPGISRAGADRYEAPMGLTHDICIRVVQKLRDKDVMPLAGTSKFFHALMAPERRIRWRAAAVKHSAIKLVEFYQRLRNLHMYPQDLQLQVLDSLLQRARHFGPNAQANAILQIAEAAVELPVPGAPSTHTSSGLCNRVSLFYRLSHLVADQMGSRDEVETSHLEERFGKLLLQLPPVEQFDLHILMLTIRSAVLFARFDGQGMARALRMQLRRAAAYLAPKGSDRMLALKPPARKIAKPGLAYWRLGMKTILSLASRVSCEIAGTLVNAMRSSLMTRVPEKYRAALWREAQPQLLQVIRHTGDNSLLPGYLNSTIGLLAKDEVAQAFARLAEHGGWRYLEVKKETTIFANEARVRATVLFGEALHDPAPLSVLNDPDGARRQMVVRALSSALPSMEDADRVNALIWLLEVALPAIRRYRDSTAALHVLLGEARGMTAPYLARLEAKLLEKVLRGPEHFNLWNWLRILRAMEPVQLHPELTAISTRLLATAFRYQHARANFAPPTWGFYDSLLQSLPKLLAQAGDEQSFLVDLAAGTVNHPTPASALVATFVVLSYAPAAQAFAQAVQSLKRQMTAEPADQSFIQGFNHLFAAFESLDAPFRPAGFAVACYCLSLAKSAAALPGPVLDLVVWLSRYGDQVKISPDSSLAMYQELSNFKSRLYRAVEQILAQQPAGAELDFLDSLLKRADGSSGQAPVSRQASKWARGWLKHWGDDTKSAGHLLLLKQTRDLNAIDTGMFDGLAYRFHRDDLAKAAKALVELLGHHPARQQEWLGRTLATNKGYKPWKFQPGSFKDALAFCSHFSKQARRDLVKVLCEGALRSIAHLPDMFELIAQAGSRVLRFQLLKGLALRISQIRAKDSSGIPPVALEFALKLMNCATGDARLMAKQQRTVLAALREEAANLPSTLEVQLLQELDARLFQ